MSTKTVPDPGLKKDLLRVCEALEVRYGLRKPHRTEDFIERGATSSSISGEKYLVRCAPAGPVPSADWLTAELTRFRAAGRGQSKSKDP